MRTIEVNLPSDLCRELAEFHQDDFSESVSMAQVIEMYPWVRTLIECSKLACEREDYLNQSYDLGEPKEQVRRRWRAEDKRRLSPHQLDGDDEVIYA